MKFSSSFIRSFNHHKLLREIEKEQATAKIICVKNELKQPKHH